MAVASLVVVATGRGSAVHIPTQVAPRLLVSVVVGVFGLGEEVDSVDVAVAAGGRVGSGAVPGVAVTVVGAHHGSGAGQRRDEQRDRFCHRYHDNDRGWSGSGLWIGAGSTKEIGVGLQCDRAVVPSRIYSRE